MRGAERQDAVDVLITELFANGAELQLQPQSLLENAQMVRGRSLTGAVVTQHCRRAHGRWEGQLPRRPFRALESMTTAAPGHRFALFFSVSSS